MITIAIPTYKRPKYLRQAIDSAVHQVDASVPYRIIVVNNDPETDMEPIAQAYRDAPVDVRFYTNERNLGMLGNINRCVELAEGEWIAFLHDDDLLLPNYIQEIGKYLEDPNTVCLIPRRYLLFEGDSCALLEEKRKKKYLLLNLFPSRHMGKASTYPIYPEDNAFTWQNCYGAPSCGVIFRKKAVERSGLFFPEGTYSWDFFSFLKLNHQNNIQILEMILSVYRMSTGLSLRSEVQLDFFKSYEQVKDRLPELNGKCADFIRKYSNEISYLDTCILDDTGRKLAGESGFPLVEDKPSRVKYLLFMIRRLHYLSTHHLDVEVPLTRNGRKTLVQMGVIYENELN